jgi:hypothetical protein
MAFDKTANGGQARRDLEQSIPGSVEARAAGQSICGLSPGISNTID